MDNWNFQREEQTFETLAAGDYRVRVRAADKAVSKNGNDMLVLQFDVSGSTLTLYHYIVFMPDRPEITNRNLTQFFDSFNGIKMGDTNTANWIGKVGAVHVKLEEYNGEQRPRIQYFIRADKASGLPAWQEPGVQSASSSASVDTGSNFEDMNLPF